MSREKWISVRVTEEENRAIEEKMKQHGMTVWGTEKQIIRRTDRGKLTEILHTNIPYVNIR